MDLQQLGFRRDEGEKVKMQHRITEDDAACTEVEVRNGDDAGSRDGRAVRTSICH